MDPKCFDDLTRVLAAPSRRKFLAAAGVTALSAFFGLGAGKTISRKKKKCSCKGRTCGCKGKCGTCGQNESCLKGQCVPVGGGCTPACTGGRECQSDGTCACPPDKPVDGTCGGFMTDECRECCTSDNCPDRFMMDCNHAKGSICECGGMTHLCEPGPLCWSCCQDNHCTAYNKPPANGFFCDPLRRCVCPEGQTVCLKLDASEYYCTNTQTDRLNCGLCGGNCQGGNCIGGQCTQPE